MKKIKSLLKKLIGYRYNQIDKMTLPLRNYQFLRFITEKINPIKISFIIAGGQKGGTTALYKFLNQHPDLSMSVIKETNFFSTEEFWNSGANYQKYIAFFRAGIKPKIYGEASPSYMLYHDVVAQRIYNYNPDMKLIFIMKNPIERAYSQYKMHVKKFNLNLPFDECIKIALEQPEEDIVLHKKSGFSTKTIKLYLKFGHYSDQIKSFQRYFKPQQILFLLTEDLMDNHNETVEKVFEFIGAQPIHINSEIVHSSNGEKLNSNKARTLLFEEYKEDIIELENLIQRDLSHWK